MKTAIDFIEDELINKNMINEFTIQLIKSARIMERIQIEDAYNDGSRLYKNAEWEKPNAGNYYEFKYHKP